MTGRGHWSGRGSLLPVRLLCLLIRGYQVVLRPVLGGHCRFHPSCSSYALEAIQRFGALRGSWMMIRRLSRCHPLGGSGFDPVPGSQDSE